MLERDLCVHDLASLACHSNHNFRAMFEKQIIRQGETSAHMHTTLSSLTWGRRQKPFSSSDIARSRPLLMSTYEATGGLPRISQQNLLVIIPIPNYSMDT